MLRLRAVCSSRDTTERTPLKYSQNGRGRDCDHISTTGLESRTRKIIQKVIRKIIRKKTQPIPLKKKKMGRRLEQAFHKSLNTCS